MKKNILLLLFVPVMALFLAQTLEASMDSVMRSVVRLSGSGAKGTTVFATGFLVECIEAKKTNNNVWLITAAHIFDQIKNDSLTVVFRSREGLVFVRHEVSLQIRTNGRDIFLRHPDHDMAAIKVIVSSKLDLCVLSHDYIGNDTRLGRAGFGPGTPVIIPGYPYGQESNNGGFAFCRQGIVSDFPVLPGRLYPVFHVDFEVFAGYSGAPVILANSSRSMLAGMVLEEVYLEELSHGRKGLVDRTSRGLGLARVLSSQIIRDFVSSLR